MTWIILIKKPPVRPSPPMFSILWATPWPNKAAMENIAQQLFDYIPGADVHYDYFGKVPNWDGAMKIHYKGQDIRVFPHEFNLLPPDRMRNYVFGLEGEGVPTHVLEPTDEAGEHMLKIVKDGDLRQIYDAALVDGCTPAQAEMVALGIPLDEGAIEFPPMGWYRPLDFVLDMYCNDHERED